MAAVYGPQKLEKDICYLMCDTRSRSLLQIQEIVERVQLRTAKLGPGLTKSFIKNT